MELQPLQSIVTLQLMPQIFDVIKLPVPQPVPSWITGSPVFFISQTDDEFSIICSKSSIPVAQQSDTDWHCFKVAGDIQPEQPGVAAAVTAPMASAGLSLILVGTHDRDYILVDSAHLNEPGAEQKQKQSCPVQLGLSLRVYPALR